MARRLHDEIHLTAVFVTHDQDRLEWRRWLVMNEHMRDGSGRGVPPAADELW